jgi:hypothetical protein
MGNLLGCWFEVLGVGSSVCRNVRLEILTKQTLFINYVEVTCQHQLQF